jgi:transposase
MRSLTVDDLRLRTDAKLLLDSLDDHIRPKDLPARFPRIMNEIARLWQRWHRVFGHRLKWKNCSILVFERSSDHETIPS